MLALVLASTLFSAVPQSPPIKTLLVSGANNHDWEWTTPEIARAAAPVRLQAALTAAMPPNNITEMTPAERRVLAGWNAGR